MIKKPILSALLLAWGLSSQAGTYSFGDTFALLPNDANSFNVSHSISDPATSISSILLTLNFSSPAALSGGIGGINGLLYLGSGTSPYYASLTPGSPVFQAGGGSPYYSTTMSFGSSSAFYQQNPNSTWTLNLWDNNTSFGNSLTGWSLDVNPVPEPVNVALAVLGFGFAAVQVGRYLGRKRAARQSSLN